MGSQVARAAILYPMLPSLGQGINELRVMGSEEQPREIIESFAYQTTTYM